MSTMTLNAGPAAAAGDATAEQNFVKTRAEIVNTVGAPFCDDAKLRMRNVNVFYGEAQAIHDVSLDIGRNEVVAMIGPSGCGKSTTLRMVAGLEEGLKVYQGKALLNSVTGEEERLEAVLPLVKKYGAAVVAISNDDTGISEDINVRFEVAKKIVHRAMDHGIPASDVVVDPLVMPVGAINTAGRQVMELIRRLREELHVNTTCGASNISFGLPNRGGLNASFLSMAIGAGMTSAITNPLHGEMMMAMRGADVMMGHDPQCAAWLRAYREPTPEGTERASRRRRRRPS